MWIVLWTTAIDGQNPERVPGSPRDNRRVRRVYPEPAAEVSVDDAYGEERRRHDDGRPWVGVCMVASVDGSTAVDGRSEGLSGPADQGVLRALRRHADVILVGAGTVRGEGYGPPKKPGQRIGVVTRSGDLAFDSPLFRSGAGFVVMPADGPDVPVEAVRAGNGSVDVEAALRHLPGDPTFVQAEGGPAFNAALVTAGVIDELNLTISPQLVAGRGARVVFSEAASMYPLRLNALLHADGFVFSRWRRSGSSSR